MERGDCMERLEIDGEWGLIFKACAGFWAALLALISVFCRIRSISASPGWDTSPSQVISPHFVRISPNNLLVPIHSPGWREAL